MRAPLRTLLILAALIGAFVFGALNPLFNYDVLMYERNAQIVRAGGNVYAEQSYYNYAPLWMYINTLWSFIADATGIPFRHVVTWSLLGVHLCAVLIVCRLRSSTRR